MSVCAEHLILCQQQSLNGAHQCATLAGKVGEYFTFEIGLKQIARPHTNTQCHYTFESLSCGILKDGIG